MSQLFMLENAGYRDLSSSEKEILEKACRRIPGIKCRKLTQQSSYDHDLGEVIFQKIDSIFVVPVAVPSQRNVTQEFLDTIHKKRPLPSLCAFCFVLFSDENLDPRQWLESFWTEIIDGYSDVAVPSSFVVWDYVESRLNTFRIVESVSSLCRELDSLGELKRLDEVMVSLEEQIVGVVRRIPEK